MGAVNSSFTNSLMDSKVLLPIHPLEILDLIDLLILKLNNLAHINIFSKSISQVIAFATLHLDYLNVKL